MCDTSVIKDPMGTSKSKTPEVEIVEGDTSDTSDSETEWVGKMRAPMELPKEDDKPAHPDEPPEWKPRGLKIVPVKPVIDMTKPTLPEDFKLVNPKTIKGDKVEKTFFPRTMTGPGSVNGESVVGNTSDEDEDTEPKHKPGPKKIPHAGVPVGTAKLPEGCSHSHHVSLMQFDPYEGVVHQRVIHVPRGERDAPGCVSASVIRNGSELIVGLHATTGIDIMKRELAIFKVGSNKFTVTCNLHGVDGHDIRGSGTLSQFCTYYLCLAQGDNTDEALQKAFRDNLVLSGTNQLATALMGSCTPVHGKLNPPTSGYETSFARSMDVYSGSAVLGEDFKNLQGVFICQTGRLPLGKVPYPGEPTIVDVVSEDEGTQTALFDMPSKVLTPPHTDITNHFVMRRGGWEVYQAMWAITPSNYTKVVSESMSKVVTCPEYKLLADIIQAMIHTRGVHGLYPYEVANILIHACGDRIPGLLAHEAVVMVFASLGFISKCANDPGTYLCIDDTDAIVKRGSLLTIVKPYGNGSYQLHVAAPLAWIKKMINQLPEGNKLQMMTFCQAIGQMMAPICHGKVQFCILVERMYSEHRLLIPHKENFEMDPSTHSETSRLFKGDGTSMVEKKILHSLTGSMASLTLSCYRAYMIGTKGAQQLLGIGMAPTLSIPYGRGVYLFLFAEHFRGADHDLAQEAAIRFQDGEYLGMVRLDGALWINSTLGTTQARASTGMAALRHLFAAHASGTTIHGADAANM